MASLPPPNNRSARDEFRHSRDRELRPCARCPARKAPADVAGAEECCTFLVFTPLVFSLLSYLASAKVVIPLVCKSRPLPTYFDWGALSNGGCWYLYLLLCSPTTGTKSLCRDLGDLPLPDTPHYLFPGCKEPLREPVALRNRYVYA